jgi:hypothetical protein
VKFPAFSVAIFKRRYKELCPEAMKEKNSVRELEIFQNFNCQYTCLFERWKALLLLLIDNQVIRTQMCIKKI